MPYSFTRLFIVQRETFSIFAMSDHVKPIDLFTVFDAILVAGQTRLQLQEMHEILADFEPL